ncbi:hypothetical protein SEA_PAULODIABOLI_174 [Microbacterium phage PauloDiaboli]|nr:hypothetical protein SEA_PAULODIABOLI_174 [Microbacterium phage PauloDiaboli]QWY83987.1 hypothetical protein SEA_A3WALLY_174 [Microbacterium phage A3Wally]
MDGEEFLDKAVKFGFRLCTWSEEEFRWKPIIRRPHVEQMKKCFPQYGGRPDIEITLSWMEQRQMQLCEGVGASWYPVGKQYWPIAVKRVLRGLKR